MRAIVYVRTGGPEVLKLMERSKPELDTEEVLVRVAVSGVNPTDWKSRRGSVPGEPLAFPEIVPNQDGAGTIVAVAPDVDPERVGERVWLWESAWKRPGGTAQAFVALPGWQAVRLPDEASFDLGASLGIPAMTAHRCLTVGEDGPRALAAGALAGRTVLVAGGAGAVGHAAIELGVWAGASVIATVSSDEKATLAKAAGAHHVVNYRAGDAAEAIRTIAPGGVDTIVEVAPVANAELDTAVIAPNGVVAAYASEDRDLSVAVRPAMTANTRYQFVLIYTIAAKAKAQAVMDLQAAVSDGALRVGADAGLPLTRFPLERTGEAHAAVERHVVGKVLIDVG